MSREVRVTRDIDDDDREDVQRAISDRQDDRQDFVEDERDDDDD